jgi:CRP-like cAMP-binding protein
MEAIPCNLCPLGTACHGPHCAFARASFPAGHIFFHQGDRPQAAHFLKRGLVLLSKLDADGEVVRQTLRPSGSLLDVQVSRGLPHRATAIAAVEVEVCSLALTSFNAWLGPQRSPSRALLELTLQEVRSADVEATRARGSATSRVAGFLLEHGGDRASRPLELQHQLIAGLLGIRPETLSRSLGVLRAAGAIAGHRRVRIANRQRLGELAAEPDAA